MSSKFSLMPLVVDQYATLVDYRTGKKRLEDYAVLVLLPVLMGVVSWVLDWRLQSVGDMVQGLAIITSLLFALAIFIFQLRLSLRAESNSTTTRLVDEMFDNACYAILVGLVLTAFVVVSGVTRESLPDGTTQPVGPFVTSCIVAISLHFLGVLAMSLKRLKAAYAKVT